jgi:hypothetical protein
MNRIVDWNMSPLPTGRSTILPYSARVVCWPSTGWIWIKQVPTVDLDYLSRSRINDTPRPAPPEILFLQAPTPPELIDEEIKEHNLYPAPVSLAPISDENLFCQKMRTIGADFWELPPVQ